MWRARMAFIRNARNMDEAILFRLSASRDLASLGIISPIEAPQEWVKFNTFCTCLGHGWINIIDNAIGVLYWISTLAQILYSKYKVLCKQCDLTTCTGLCIIKSQAIILSLLNVRWWWIRLVFWMACSVSQQFLSLPDGYIGSPGCAFIIVKLLDRSVVYISESTMGNGPYAHSECIWNLVWE